MLIRNGENGFSNGKNGGQFPDAALQLLVSLLELQIQALADPELTHLLEGPFHHRDYFRLTRRPKQIIRSA